MPLLYGLLLLAVDPQPLPDARAMVEQAIQAGVQNRGKSANWLGREDIKQYDLRKGRKLRDWVTYEASKLEGENYYKLVARDGKPLSKGRAAKEQEAYDREALRRRLTPQNLRGGPGATAKRYSISLPQVLAFHNLQYSGEDTVHGRKIWIVDTRLRDAAPKPREPDDLALGGNMTLWIDQATKLVVMQELRFTRQWAAYGPGSMVRYEMEWNGEVMLPSKITIQLTGIGVMKEQVYTNYRHFGADSKIQFEPSAATNENK